MTHAPESPETQGPLPSGAERCPLPDGSVAVRLATRRGVRELRGYWSPGARRAVLFVAPAAFLPTSLALGGHLANRGVAALWLRPAPGADPGLETAEAAGFLRAFGVCSLAVCGAGALARTAVESARALQAEALLLLAPDPFPRFCTLGPTPTLVCAGGAPPAVAQLPAHVGYLAFPGAAPTLDQVLADLAAQALPVLFRALGVHDA